LRVTGCRYRKCKIVFGSVDVAAKMEGIYKRPAAANIPPTMAPRTGTAVGAAAPGDEAAADALDFALETAEDALDLREDSAEEMEERALAAAEPVAEAATLLKLASCDESAEAAEL
jgi:hypothetical protein